MRSFSLAPYLIRIKEDYQEGYCQVADFDGNGSDLFQSIINFLTFNQVMAVNPDAETALQVSTINNRQRYRDIAGIIKSGHFGVESELIDCETQQIAHFRRATEAEMLPFYYLVWVPRYGDEAILILQRSGQLGIKSVFEESLAADFRNANNGFSLEINKLVPQDIIETLVGPHAAIKSIRFRKFDSHADITDAITDEVDGHRDVDFDLEYKIKAKRGEYLPLSRYKIINRIREIFAGRRQVGNFLEVLDEYGGQIIDYDTVNIDVVINGKERTFNVGDINKVNAHLDITDEVDIAANGFPEYASINQQAQRFLDDCRQGIAREVD